MGQSFQPFLVAIVPHKLRTQQVRDLRRLRGRAPAAIAQGTLNFSGKKKGIENRSRIATTEFGDCIEQAPGQCLARDRLSSLSKDNPVHARHAPLISPIICRLHKEPSTGGGMAPLGRGSCGSAGTQLELKNKASVMLTRVTQLWVAVRVEDVCPNPDTQR